MTHSRRAVLAGLGSGVASLLFSRTLLASSLHDEQAAPAGLLVLSLVAATAGTLKISIAPASDPLKPHELGVVDRDWPAPLEQAGTPQEHTVAWGKYTLQIKSHPLRIIAMEGMRVRQEIQFDMDSTDVRFKLNGPVFGLGEGVHPYDRRGTRDEMSNGQHNPDLKVYGARLPIPWVISPQGWGIFVGQPSGDFDFTQIEGRFRGAEATSTRNVFLLLGDTPADVLGEYANLTGYPHLPPLWAFGYHQSHRTLSSREEILTEAKTFREKKLPCDAMIYLGTGFCPSGWNSGHGSFTFNQDVFPDPAADIKSLHAENMKVVLHIVPPGDFHGTIADEGAEVHEPGDAVGYWAKHEELLKIGVDGWWPDEGDRLSVYARLQRNQMYYEGSRKAHPTRRSFALHRNGYAGLQRYGWLWSGDTFSTWQALRAQIMVGINVGLSGIPFWGTDTGGFVPTPEYTPELWVRWFQFSAFCPSFRSHGRAWKLHLPWGWNMGTPGPKEVEGEWVTSWPREADLHRPEIEGICRKYLELRYQMLPYIYSTAAQSHGTGIPMIRALWLAYPDDSKALLIEDAYLWGDNILVAPVFEKDSTSRMVYLPRGRWWNYWSMETMEGAKDVSASAPLDTIPLFIKAGGIVPMGPVKQFTGEKNDIPTTLRIFPGADGNFDWYEDDGESFEFEKGHFSKVHCSWNEEGRMLTLTPNTGSSGVRKVRVILAGESTSKEITVATGVVKIKL
jgi:alpha-glucosidase (family GH31 glycosyl hydrolase)